MPTYSFRLGSTSYVYPGDLRYNVERLAGDVADIELVLFDLATGENNLPSPELVRELDLVAAAPGLTYTVHLPVDLRHDPLTVHPSLVKAHQVIDLTAPLDPYAYVFHLEGTGIGTPSWLEQAQQAIAELIAMVDTPTRLALENLESYDPEWLEPIFAAFPIRRTLDIGHLWKAGRDPLPVLEAWLPATRVIHLHGVAGADHRSLALMAPSQLDPIIARLLDWPGVLTLEVFEEDFFTSREALFRAVDRVISPPGEINQPT
jgi:sugar phosphate isomerase/epimerase